MCVTFEVMTDTLCVCVCVCVCVSRAHGDQRSLQAGLEEMKEQYTGAVEKIRGTVALRIRTYTHTHRSPPLQLQSLLSLCSHSVL